MNSKSKETISKNLNLFTNPTQICSTEENSYFSSNQFNELSVDHK